MKKSILDNRPFSILFSCEYELNFTVNSNSESKAVRAANTFVARNFPSLDFKRTVGKKEVSFLLIDTHEVNVSE